MLNKHTPPTVADLMRHAWSCGLKHADLALFVQLLTDDPCPSEAEYAAFCVAAQIDMDAFIAQEEARINDLCLHTNA